MKKSKEKVVVVTDSNLDTTDDEFTSEEKALIVLWLAIQRIFVRFFFQSSEMV